MQDLSYSFHNAYFNLWGYCISVMVYTFENAYSLDPALTEVQMEESSASITAKGLLWAGGQEHARGWVRLQAWPAQGGVRLTAQAGGLNHSIRSLKVTVHDLKPGRLMNKLDLTQPEIMPEGILMHYPEGWRTMDTPMVIIGHPDGTMTCLRSLDERVRDKRFALMRTGDTTACEMIFEQYAAEISDEIDVPAWEIAPCASVSEAYERQKAHIARAYDLVAWEEREDVPAWAREISLVASIHCQHWTGYIFNDYRSVLKNLEWMAERIEPKRILAYLPGWEGRYYWKYGNYCPDERMGGSKDFHYLCDGAREMGVHLMPMYGVNIVNRCLPEFEQWGQTSLAQNANGETGCGSVDWDGSRHYCHGSNAGLNPSAPQWQNRLARQIIQICEEYGVRAAFLDIAACWYNDPHFKPTNIGVKELCDRIRRQIPDMLMAGEAWYDGLTPAMPLIHSGHTDGPMHYHDAIHAPFFDTWMREFAHLCLGDPSRGSTGAHELGTNRVDWRVPLRKGLWPTVTIVDSTIKNAPDKVEEIIGDAKEYARRYLK